MVSCFSIRHTASICIFPSGAPSCCGILYHPVLFPPSCCPYFSSLPMGTDSVHTVKWSSTFLSHPSRPPCRRGLSLLPQAVATSFPRTASYSPFPYGATASLPQGCTWLRTALNHGGDKGLFAGLDTEGNFCLSLYSWYRLPHRHSRRGYSRALQLVSVQGFLANLSAKT